ncbi:MAG: nucleoside-diphosphate kinase, partial [Planctomycetota bacterium]
MQTTFIFIKPDAVQRGLIGQILERFERKGLSFVGMKLVQVSEDLATQHYAEHAEKPFFPG